MMTFVNALYPYVKGVPSLCAEYLKDSFSVQLVLETVSQNIKNVIEKKELRRISLAPKYEMEQFIGDAVVSLSNNRILLKQYIKARANQIQNTLSSDEVTMSCLANIGKELGIKLEQVGNLFKIKLIDYIKLTEGTQHIMLLPVNQSVIDGTVRLTRQVFISVLTMVMERKLNDILPLNFENVRVPSFIIDEAKEIAKLSKEAGLTIETIAPTALKMDLMPPCVRNVIGGVQRGERNFAISVFLTSLLSYARLLPPLDKKDVKIEDYINPKILVEEIMPIIEEAARNAKPAFFAESPHERDNVLRTLGLDKDYKTAPQGVWYHPPSCKKIQTETSVCTPDDFCRFIKSPLAYYIKKLKKETETTEKAEGKTAVATNI